MIRLGVDENILRNIYQEIEPNQLGVEKEVTEENRYGQASHRLAWFWNVNNVLDSQQDPWMDELLVYRVHWLKAKARWQRWEEELSLVQHEMGWTLLKASFPTALGSSGYCLFISAFMLTSKMEGKMYQYLEWELNVDLLGYLSHTKYMPAGLSVTYQTYTGQAICHITRPASPLVHYQLCIQPALKVEVWSVQLWAPAANEVHTVVKASWDTFYNHFLCPGHRFYVGNFKCTKKIVKAMHTAALECAKAEIEGQEVEELYASDVSENDSTGVMSKS
ncbi:uncharacterized protein F5891DRAFT_979428 [Suillus fuscotomentosus]|uniref:Uncharacterized protein n=1 Tax=Suillus fuscotomentosus TaxID=1912939 RepID=A0AAD4E8J9_9AGAM|nr:uncharacterized protein F5891DRAFT_979428 [Suillus fuscotomentosus]KAG1901611.1 hypothetical protein F5891DRAFT_979428 [Suillus fuscotomentosus]